MKLFSFLKKFRKALCSKASVLALFFCSFAGAAFTQTYENRYTESLDTVLKEIEQRFKVHLHYSSDLVKARTVPFARWRFKSDLKTTLDNILKLNDLVYYKVNDTAYNVAPFQYWQQTAEEGKQQLDSFLTSYTTLAQWEARKAMLQKCLLQTLGLEALPPWPASTPIVSGKRNFNGYSVQNIALETLPGVYVCGSLYSPLQAAGKKPVILSPNGHFGGGRYRPDQQYRCAALARMGALVFTYDLLGWGESRLQFKDEDHYTSTAMLVQTLNSFRVLDFLCALKNADTTRVAMTGASGGGSQTLLLTALTNRVKVSVPVVMASAYYAGGCPCETGIPIHFCGGGTNNVELAAMAAPRPQLLVSDGQDWTDRVPQMEFPYLQKVYALYNKTGLVKNVHLPDEGHDYGASKRTAMYRFMAAHLNLDLRKVTTPAGTIDESACTIEPEQDLLVFGKGGEKLPLNAVKGMAQLQQLVGTTLPRR